MYGVWATMSLSSEQLLVTPFNLLPIERQYYPDPAPPAEIRDQQEKIWSEIVNRPNYELEYDEHAMELVRRFGCVSARRYSLTRGQVNELCPDTIINAFACNFKVNGVVNTDVVEANFLNTRMYQRLSMSSLADDLSDRPLLILRTEFSQAGYKDSLTVFKNRIGLSGPEDLVALSNVSMQVHLD